MPLSEKGKKILASMISSYGSEKKGKQVFYAMENSDKLRGIKRRRKRRY